MTRNPRLSNRPKFHLYIGSFIFLRRLGMLGSKRRLLVEVEKIPTRSKKILEKTCAAGLTYFIMCECLKVPCKCITYIICFPILLLVSIFFLLIWLILLPFKLCCCPVGCFAQCLADILETFVKAPFKFWAWLWS